MPESSFKYDVFLSHSSKDKHIVCPLAERLRKDSLRVWLDEWEIRPGDNITSKIEEGLERARVLVLCMSANACGSDWATLESQTLRFRDPLNKDRRFIPLRLDESPIIHSLSHFIDVKWLPEGHDHEYRKLLAACRPLPDLKASGIGAAHEQVQDSVIRVDADSNVASLVFSRDGKRFLTAGIQNVIQLWEIDTVARLRTLKATMNAEPIPNAEGGPALGIWSLAWSSNERRVLSGSQDMTVRLWDLESQRCIRIFKGHTGPVRCVSLSADESRALSTCWQWGSETMFLWDVEAGSVIRALSGHTSTINSVVWSADQQHALSGSDDLTLRLWNVNSGRCLRVLEGHSGLVSAVTLSANRHHALSGSLDTTVRVWDVDSGRCLRVLEGHTKEITAVALSSNGRHALSSSEDKTVRLWDLDSDRCLKLVGHEAMILNAAWSGDYSHVISGDENGTICYWDVSHFESGDPTSSYRTISSVVPDQAHYANAKVLLVGDTGVGKSGLTERLVHGRFAPTKSSHARQAHVLESKVVKESSGVSLHRETILWDLAGQPAYRSVHQLSMDDAAMACVLFDARSETNPFEGPAYWSQVLDQARTNAKLKKLLIASRIDVGGLPAGRERIEAFARDNGFEKLIPTSASTGEGCAELLDAIRNGIPWDEIPKVTTPRVLMAVRDYVAKLKGEKSDTVVEVDRTRRARLLSIQSLHEGFSADYGQKIPLAEFIAHLQRLEASDTVSLLVFSSTGAAPRPEDMVLLDPTRVDAYSSALLVAAKDEPDGPGHLLESRVRDGKFTLDQNERISDSESERHLLWFVMEKLLSRDLSLRERIKGEDYVVFPSQCTAELRFPGLASFGVTYGFAGPVRSIYARLIAHLAHYEGFKKREFYQDAAAYRAEAGGRCLLRLSDRGRGQGELEVLYDSETPAPVRQGFMEFVGKQLEANSTPGSVTKRLAYHCANEKCGNPFEDRVVRARLEAGKKNLICPICEIKTPLVDLLAPPTAASESVAAQIEINARTGRQRMTAAFVIKAKEAEGKFDVFLSHNSKDKAVVEKIAKQLKAVGLRPWLDKWNLAGGDTLMDALEQAIKTIPCAALCFGPADVGRWHIMEIRSYVSAWANKSARMIPVILPGVEKAPELPLFVQQTLWVDMRDWDKEESDGFYQIVCAILGRPPGDAPMKRFGVRDVAEWQRKRP